MKPVKLWLFHEDRPVVRYNAAGCDAADYKAEPLHCDLRSLTRLAHAVHQAVALEEFNAPHADRR